jgi:Ca2+-transporting ATPase
MTTTAVPQVPWHAQSADQICTGLETDPARGLSPEEAALRLTRHGSNRLTQKPPRPAWLKFLDQFRNVLTGVLIGAAALAGAIGDLKDAVVILIVVVFNAGLGFHQEYRAEKTLAALKGMLARRARVRRGGELVEVGADDLVPGDLVLLEAGDRIPADGRFLATHNVEVDEAALTGESLAVGKHIAPVAADAPLAERVNMGFMNTSLTRGRAEMLVTATGMATEMGRLAAMLEAAEEGETPLQKELDRVGKRLAAIAVAVIAVILAVGIGYGHDAAKAVLNAVALAVAAIPEGLPAVVTVTLAVGMYRMAQQKAIVKKLAAVETLGSTTVICSDKTGTLTLNQMTARALFYRGRRFRVSGEGYAAAGEITVEDGAGAPDSVPDLAPLLLPMALCSESRIADGKLIGDPTEGALLALAAKGGIEPEAALEHRPRIAEIPFDSAHKFMATFHHAGEAVLLLVKGAPDVLLARSTRWTGPGGETALDDAVREQLLAENEHLAARAFRVLAVASKVIPARDFEPSGDLFAWVTDLAFQGLAGIQDPPRPEAREAITLCRHAGIQVKMITGDHRVTAAAIARELGLHGEVMSGAELDAVSAHDLAATVERIAVFARVAPEHKVKIVAALKEKGHVVAMTGDGVNDAPALKTADIGVAMGITGTEVTREAAAMVLADDNFATIVGAVKEGRTIFENIVKFVRFQLSTNIGAILTVSAATFMGLPAPFTAIQILWVNIIMDGPPAMTLGVDPPRAGVMDAAPRLPGQAILSAARIMRLIQYGLTMAVGTLAVFWWALQAGDEGRAATLAFTTFVLFQFFNAMNARNETGSAFNRQLFVNGKLWLALAAVIALQIVVVHWGPAQAVFHTVDLDLYDWGLAGLVAASVLLLEEARKLAARCFSKRR